MDTGQIFGVRRSTLNVKMAMVSLHVDSIVKVRFEYIKYSQ